MLADLADIGVVVCAFRLLERARHHVLTREEIGKHRRQKHDELRAEAFCSAAPRGRSAMSVLLRRHRSDHSREWSRRVEVALVELRASASFVCSEDTPTAQARCRNTPLRPPRRERLSDPPAGHSEETRRPKSSGALPMLIRDMMPLLSLQQVPGFPVRDPPSRPRRPSVAESRCDRCLLSSPDQSLRPAPGR